MPLEASAEIAPETPEAMDRALAQFRDPHHMRGAPGPIKSSKTAQNETLADRLWTVSEKVTGVSGKANDIN
jgi:hypothetical protein